MAKLVWGEQALKPAVASFFVATVNPRLAKLKWPLTLTACVAILLAVALAVIGTLVYLTSCEVQCRNVSIPNLTQASVQAADTACPPVRVRRWVRHLPADNSDAVFAKDAHR